MVIDYGNRLLKPTLADVLTKTFLDTSRRPTRIPLAEAADRARARMIDEGVVLRLGTAGEESPQVLELTRGDAIGSTSHLLEVREPVRRALPDLGDLPAKIVLSPTGTDAALAWVETEHVRYLETGGDGWSGVKSLTLDSSLDVEDAFELLEKRLDGN